MMQRERQSRILAHLDAHEVLSVEDAVPLLRASPATVRRDFNALAAQQLVERTRGGVGRARPGMAGMMPFGWREDQHPREKAALARQAAGMLKPGDVIMVDGGTSTFHLAECLPDFPLRVITTSVRLAAVLGERRLAKTATEVFLTGGYLYPESSLLIGPQAAATLAQYRANWAFLSVGGICEDGIYNTNEFVIESERTMIRNADRTVVLADHSKVGRRSMCRICGLDEIDIVITDDHPDTRNNLQALGEAGVEISTVPLTQ